MRVLIIESDLAFAATLRQALEARGVEVDTTADGKRGVELAHAKPPAAVVLAVELGDRLTGGFTWCNKFKRDDALKAIPLLLTSSLATEQTFEQHRKLKTRADDYLLKPFGPRDLLDRLDPYLPRPPAPADGDGTVDLVGELLAGLDDERPAVNAAVSPESDDDARDGLLDTDPEEDDEGYLLDAEPTSDSIGDEPAEDPDDDVDPASAGEEGEDDFDILAADLVDELEFASAGPDAALTAALSSEPPRADNPWSDATPSPSVESGAGRLTELETRLATLAAELEASRKEAADLRAQLGAAHTDLAMTKGEAIALQERVSSLEADLADGKDREAVLSRKLELDEALRTDLRAALTSALSRLDDA